MTARPRWSALAVLVPLSFCGCARVPPPDSMQGRVTLRGRVVAASPLVPGAAVSALGPEAAVKVVVTQGDRYEVHDVVGGGFEFPVSTDRTAGLLLVGPSDESLGFVAVRGSIPGVPVQAVDEGVSSIDLGTLVASGAVLAPGIDPIGHGITLDADEIVALSELGVIARGFLADPDVDDDGVVDLLQAREFRLQVAELRNGTFSGLVGQPVGGVDGWSLGVNVAEGGTSSYPSTATVDGPPGSGVVGVITDGRMGGSQNVLYGIPLSDPAAPPTPGLWTLTYGSRVLTFDLGDLTPIAQAAPSLEPTVYLDAEQRIARIEWSLRLADGTVSAAPTALAADVRIQILAGAPAVRCPASNLTSFSPDDVYAMRLPADTVSHVLACQDIPWSAVTSVQLSYADLFGTTHTFIFAR